jgi:micrococcal nuclease
MRRYPDSWRPGRGCRRLVLVLTCWWACAWASPAHAERGWIVSVVDGDTVDVQPVDGSPRRRLRLEGIDAPEICQDGGVEARLALARGVLMRFVDYQIRRDDDYGRGLARVWLEGEDIAARLVFDGHAWSYRYQRGQGPYITQEMAARAAGRGVFAQPAPEPPREFRRRHGSCH